MHWFGALALIVAAESPAAGEVKLDMVQVTVIEQIQVPALEKGALAALDVREGDLVERGQVLGHLDEKQAQIDIRRAEAELEKAREESENDVNKRFAVASLKVAEAEYKRAREAVEKFSGAISKTELERLDLTVQKSALQIEQSDRDQRVASITTRLHGIALDAAQLMLDRHRFESPVAGMVVQVHRRPGEWVNPGEPVVRILRLDRLRVEGFLDSKEHGPDLKGRPVMLTVNLPGKPNRDFQGTVVFVSPEVEPVTGQFRVWAEVENPEFLLRPGLQGSLSILPPAPADGTVRLNK